jgi:hypothetical protein
MGRISFWLIDFGQQSRAGRAGTVHRARLSGLPMKPGGAAASLAGAACSDGLGSSIRVTRAPEPVDTREGEARCE